jgi:hypothetical protein
MGTITAARTPDVAEAPLARKRRRLAKIALVTVLVLLGAEAAMRVRASALPAPGDWAIPAIGHKFEQIRELEQRGGASVVFLGASTVDAGLDPDRFTVKPGDRPAYNAAVRGGTMSVIATWAKHVAIPRLRPDVVVLGLSSRELNENDKPRAVRERAFYEAPAVRELLGKTSMWERAERRLGRASALFKYRTKLRDPRYIPALVGIGELPAEDGNAADDHVGTGGELTAFERGRYAGADFFKNQTRPIPIGTAQRTQLRDLLTFLRSRAPRVLVVNMPVTNDYVSTQTAAQRSAFDAILAAEAKSAGASYVKTGIWPTQLFADPTHTNGTGAQRLASTLSKPVSDARAAAQRAGAPQPPPPGVSTRTTEPRLQDTVDLDDTKIPSTSSRPDVPAPPPAVPQAPVDRRSPTNVNPADRASNSISLTTPSPP